MVEGKCSVRSNGDIMIASQGEHYETEAASARKELERIHWADR